MFSDSDSGAASSVSVIGGNREVSTDRAGEEDAILCDSPDDSCPNSSLDRLPGGSELNLLRRLSSLRRRIFSRLNQKLIFGTKMRNRIDPAAIRFKSTLPVKRTSTSTG